MSTKDDDFGSGDFTFEMWGDYKPEAWTHIPIQRATSASKFYVHNTEEFEGVLFVSMRVYGADKRLERVQLTRADLVRGSGMGQTEGSDDQAGAPK